MIRFFEPPEDLYKTGIKLFLEAGHTPTSDVVYINHTPEQVVYFDTSEDIYLSLQQRSALTEAVYISHLFDITEDLFDNKDKCCVGFYSVEINTTVHSRSQSAYDIHSALCAALSGEANVILFRHEGKLLISVQGFDSEIVLSDWFDEYTEFDVLLERIHVCNVSLSSVRDYVGDLIYACARWYHIYPISGEMAAYDMLPVNCFSSTDLEAPSLSKEELKEIIRDALNTAANEYGYDYVESGITHHLSDRDISAELDLLSLDLDMEDEEGFAADIFDDEEYADDYEDEEDEVDTDQADEYEFESFDAEIFRDPLQMIKLLEAEDKKEKQVDFMRK